MPDGLALRLRHLPSLQLPRLRLLELDLAENTKIGEDAGLLDFSKCTMSTFGISYLETLTLDLASCNIGHRGIGTARTKNHHKAMAL